MIHVTAVDIVTVSIRRRRRGDDAVRCHNIYIFIILVSKIQDFHAARAARDSYKRATSQSISHDDKRLYMACIIYLWDDDLVAKLHKYNIALDFDRHHSYPRHIPRKSANCTYNTPNVVNYDCFIDT